MKKYILSIDQGTSSCRSAILDIDANFIGLSQKEIPLEHPEKDWVEQDAELIWRVQLESILEVVKKCAISLEDIISIGITNQRETVVAWDRQSGRAVSKAISWQDKRTKIFCNKLKKEGLDIKLKKKTGLVTDTYFSGSKMHWILNHNTEAQNLASEGNLCIGNIDSFLIYKLTKGASFATESTNASRTLLFDIRKKTWDPELMDLFEVPENILPTVLESASHFGDAIIDGVYIPINAVLGDQQSALFGQGCFYKGMVKCTLGTGAFILLNTGKDIFDSKHGLLNTIAWTIKGETQYAIEGSVFIAGAVMQWLRDNLKILHHTDQSSEIAYHSSSEDLYFVPAFSGLGTPHWNMDSTGLITGISRSTNASDLIKASLESIAFQCRDVLIAMEEDNDIKIESINFDGGASSNDYLMQFQSDILHREIYKAVDMESTVLGVAYLSGLSSGIWTWEDLKRFSSQKLKYSPQMKAEKRTHLLEGWAKAIKKTNNYN